MQEIVTYTILFIAFGFAVKWVINQTNKPNDGSDENSCSSGCCEK